MINEVRYEIFWPPSYQWTAACSLPTSLVRSSLLS